MPTSSPAPAKVHRLGFVFTPSGTRFLACKDRTLSIEIAEGSDVAMKAARNKAKTIVCTKTPSAFSSDWEADVLWAESGAATECDSHKGSRNFPGCSDGV